MQIGCRQWRHSQLGAHPVIARCHPQLIRNGYLKRLRSLQNTRRERIDGDTKRIDVLFHGQQGFRSAPCRGFASSFIYANGIRSEPFFLGEIRIDSFRFRVGITALFAGHQPDPTSRPPKVIEQQASRRRALHIDKRYVAPSGSVSESDNRYTAIPKEGDERIICEGLDDNRAIDLDRVEIEIRLEWRHQAECQVPR